MSPSFRFREEWLAEAGTEFTWRSALALVSACKVAYNPPASAEALAQTDWGMQAQAFAVGESQGIILENHRVTVIAFRGTDSVADWLGNLRIAPRHVPDFGGALHRGFFEAYGHVAPIVAEAVGRSSGRALWFTGHSLGGALALIAALTHRESDIAGVMTFGQPRLLGRRPSRQVAGRFGPRYRRFVNRDDIVTRVPPGYSHSGHKIHFTGSGTEDVDFGTEEMPDAEAMTDSGPADSELPVADFVALQETIDTIASEIEAGPVDDLGIEGTDAPPEEMLDASVEGLVPGVSDHRIDAYVAEVNARASAEISVEGLHETFELRRHVSFRQAAQITEEPLFPFGGPVERSGAFPGTTGDLTRSGAPPTEREAAYLVRLDEARSWTPPEGVRLRSIVSNIASVTATSIGVERLSGDRSVLTIEPSREAGIADLQDSVPHVKGTAVHTRPGLAERGDKALVGVIDTGIDILHRAFDDETGASRILAIWLQWDQSGPSPHAVDPDAFTQDYGTLYVADDIAGFRTAFETQGTAPPRGLRDEFSGHGTHVSSIAAGRRFADLGDGMAPEAGIVVVAAHTSSNPDNPDEPRSIGYSASHVDALDFLKTVARGRSSILDTPRPMAINVSLGMNAGAHDGQTTLESAFDGITDNGREPGLVIVKSAGNERGHGGHASVQAAQGAVVEMAWRTDANDRKLDYLEGWFEPGDDIEFTLLAPDGARVGPVNFDQSEEAHEAAGYVCRLTMSEGHSDNGHNRIAIAVERKFGGRIPDGRWALELLARRIVSSTAMVHVWAERVRDRSVRFEQPNPKMTLSIPGTARSVVTVGACNSSFPMKLLSASSLGLTRDGRPKPELCAPGEAIWAARANAERDAKTVKDGTSMAAPHVAGAVALVFSAQHKAGTRQSNAVQIQQKLRLTTQNFSHIHNPGFGSGVLDAEKFFDELT